MEVLPNCPPVGNVPLSIKTDSLCKYAFKDGSGKRKTRTVHKNNWFAQFLVVHFVINPSKKGQKVKEKKKK